MNLGGIMLRHAKKRKNHIKYYPAPERSRASYFFTSFFLTLAVLGAVISFAVADGNSRKLGWNQDSEVFAVSNSKNDVGITLLGRNFVFKKLGINSFDADFEKGKQIYTDLEPEPVKLLQMTVSKLENEAEKLIGGCQKYLPENLRANSF